MESKVATGNFTAWKCGNPDQGLPQNLIVLRSKLRFGVVQVAQFLNQQVAQGVQF